MESRCGLKVVSWEGLKIFMNPNEEVLFVGALSSLFHAFLNAQILMASRFVEGY
jgi:hypothetical protein